MRSWPASPLQLRWVGGWTAPAAALVGGGQPGASCSRTHLSRPRRALGEDPELRPAPSCLCKFRQEAQLLVVQILGGLCSGEQGGGRGHAHMW